MKQLLIVFLAILAVPTFAFADYSQLFIFGDSLSDSGAYVGNPDAVNGQRFTTDPGPVWVENLGAEWGVTVTANNPNNTNTDPNGNNYAQGGAQVSSPIGIGTTPSPQSAQPITTQLQTYLSAHTSGDSDALYVVWGGANDVFYNAALSAGGAPPDLISSNLQTSAIELNGVIQALDQHGAKVILVPMLPDIGKTPSTIMTAIQTAGAGNPNLSTALGTAAVVLTQPALTPAEQQQVRTDAMAAADAALGVPSGTVAATEQVVAAGFTDMSSGYNSVLGIVTAVGNANVVPLDVAGFLAAVTADPAAFGFTNVTGFACGVGALPCAPGGYVPGTEETFLFADPVHPTTGGHEALSDYALSVLSAPGLISTLPDVAISDGRTYLTGMNSQMGLVSQIKRGTWAPFITGSFHSIEADSSNGIPSWDTDEIAGLFGAIYRTEGEWSFGISAGKSQGDVDWGNNAGGFDYDSTFGLISVQHQGETLRTNFTLGYGSSDYDDIQRRTAMRDTVRTHNGTTESKQIMLALTGRAELLHTGIATFGPIYGLSYQKVYVDGYSESEGEFDSLGYTSQERDSLMAEIGLFGKIAVTDKISLDMALAREKELSGDKTAFDSYLVTLPTQKFNLPGTKVDDDFWRIGVQAEMLITDSIVVSASGNYRKGDDYESNSSFNMGLQIAF